MESFDYLSLNNSSVLLVDDEIEILNLMKEVLLKEGFTNITTAMNGKDAINLCRNRDIDVVVLDIMLPDIDGIEVCKKIREFSYCSILFLSAKDDNIDKIIGLSSGGDDYVTKPFSTKELCYRIKAQLRRQNYAAKEHLNINNTKDIGDIKFDLENYEVKKNNRLIEFTAKELDIIFYFIQNPNKIISKDKIYERVWGETSSICDNTVMVHIRHLREKLEDDPSKPNLIITVKGLGYKLVDKDVNYEK